ncbi:uncharacterized protein LOC142329083 isoform X2 [Lycorma delicatula]|uniref:uncharacterized protein LOC142329083 isoform X2 n=1 Tax=Lycorma delicatula TaxID=130591 RepID=UPI003F50E0A4
MIHRGGKYICRIYHFNNHVIEMEHQFNRHYQKLKVKKKLKQTKPLSLKINTEINDVVNSKDEETFKIERFMNDIKKYGKASTSNEAVDDDENFNRDANERKIRRNKDGNKKQAMSFKEKKGIGGKFALGRREGIFQRGIITKNFNKGLMPPTLKARLNEDLQKMIRLANGRRDSTCKDIDDNKRYHRKSNNDDVWNKISSFRHRENEIDEEESINRISRKTYPKHFSEEVCDDNHLVNTLPVNTNKVEVEVQVNKPPQLKSRALSDLYLEFTHFVTRSVFNSDISKMELKQYTSSLKESLIEIYNDRKENDYSTPFSIKKSDTSSPNLNEESKPKDIQCDTPLLKIPHVHLWPTSRSEEGPFREKDIFSNDSQLSDDIIIRKPKKLYSCGLEYLKAVYGNSEDHDAYKLNFDLKSNFSPIFQDTSYNVKSDHCLSYNIKRNCNDNYDKLSTNNCLFDETKNCDITCNCDSFEPDNYLQFYHGTNEKKYHNPDGILNKTETSSYTVCKNSPEYISLLPPNHKLNSSFLNKLCGKQTSTNVMLNGSGDGIQISESILTLPAHVPPRKSPDIQYFPRKMF